jgi:hypothetical protein
MPKADPSWTARIQPLAETGTNPRLSSDAINLIALVDEAAREHDIPSLIRLSNGDETAQALSQPGLLDGLVTLLEKTHPIGQDGYTYPGFELSGGTGAGGTDLAVEKADAVALGVSSPVGYKGVHANFNGSWSGAGADGSLTWVNVLIG